MAKKKWKKKAPYAIQELQVDVELLEEELTVLRKKLRKKIRQIRETQIRLGNATLAIHREVVAGKGLDERLSAIERELRLSED